KSVPTASKKMALVIGGKRSTFNAQGRTESVGREWSEAGARDIDGKPQRGSERARANHSVEPTNRSGGQPHLFVRVIHMLPVEHNDPINAKILAISEDKIEG